MQILGGFQVELFGKRLLIGISQAEAFQLALQLGAPGRDVLLAVLAFEPIANLRPGALGIDKLKV
jgi:hypothetical protein